jgi:hypothetical protein
VYLTDKDKSLKQKDGKKIFQAKIVQMQAVVSILISDKADFTIKVVRKHKEGHFILIKGIIHEEEVTIANKYLLNIDAPALCLN